MTLSTTTPRVTAAGNGVTTAFVVTGVKVWASSDLLVYLRDDTTLIDTLQTITTHYTVSGTLPGTPTVNFVSAPASGKTVIMIRRPSVSQDLDLIASGSFAAENVETALDKLAGFTQSLALQTDWLEGSATVDVASIANGAASAEFYITVTGAAFGDPVVVSASGSLFGLMAAPYVVSANTVAVRLLNFTGSTVDLGSLTYFASVKKRK